MRKILLSIVVLALVAAGGAFWFFKQQTGVGSADEARALIDRFNVMIDSMMGESGMAFSSSTLSSEPQSDGSYVVISTHGYEDATLQANLKDVYGDWWPETVQLRHVVREQAASTSVTTTLAEQDFLADLKAMTNGEEPITQTTSIRPTGLSYDGVIAALTYSEDDLSIRTSKFEQSGKYAYTGQYSGGASSGPASFTFALPEPEIEVGEDADPPIESVTISYAALSGKGEGRYVPNDVNQGDVTFDMTDVLVRTEQAQASAERVDLLVSSKDGGKTSTARMSLDAIGLDLQGQDADALTGIKAARMSVGVGPFSKEGMRLYQKQAAEAQKLAETDPQAAQAAVMAAFLEVLKRIDDEPLKLDVQMATEGESASNLDFELAVAPMEDLDAETLLPRVVGAISAEASMKAPLGLLFADNPEQAAMLVGAGFLVEAEEGSGIYEMDAKYAQGMLSLNGGPAMPIFQLLGALGGLAGGEGQAPQ